MKLGIFGDVHLRGSDFEEKLSIMESMFETFRTEGVDHIFCTGDLFDSGHVGDSKISWDTIVYCMLSLFDNQIPITICEGNHDYWNPKGLGPLRVLEVLDNVTVVSRNFRSFDLSSDVKVVVLPWVDSLRWSKHNLENYRKFLEKKPFEICESRILIAHLELNGSRGDNDRILNSDGLNSWSKDGIDQLGFDKVFLGHYHKPQEFGNIEYVGSILQNNFGERDNKTRYLIYDTESKTIKEFLTFGSFYYKHVADELITLPKGRQLIDAHVRVYGADSLEKIKEAEALFNSDTCKSVRFIDAADQVIDRSQTTEITKEMTFFDKLDSWISEAGLELDKESVKEYLDYFEDLTVDTDQVGYLESVDRIHLKNIFTHKNREVCFQGGSMSILGPNGTGKTFLLESLFAGVYGKWASPDRPLTGSPNASLLVEFTARGDQYRVVREVVNGKTTAIAYVKDGDAFVEVAGGSSKTLQLNEFLKRLVGSSDILKGCCYIENRQQDLIEETSSNRMKWIRDWLGFGVYEDYNKYLKTKVLEFKDIEQTRQTHLAHIKIAESEVEYDTKQKAIAEEGFNEWNQKAGDLRAEYEKLENRLVKMRRTLDRRQSLQMLESQLEENKLSLEKLADTYKSTVELHAKTKAECDSVEEFRKKHETLSNLKSKAEWDAKEVEKAGCKSNPIPCVFIKRGLEAQNEVKSFEVQLRNLGWTSLREANYQELQKKLQSLCKTVDSIKNETKSLVRTIEYQTQSIEKMKENFDEVDVRNYDKVVDAKADVEVKLKAASNQLEDFKVKLRVHTLNIDKAKKNIAVLQSRIPEIEHQWKVKQNLDVLLKATSKEGLVQSLIHNELPKIQKYVDNLCSEIDADFRVMFKTQRELKNKNLEESFDIMFHRRGVSYDIRSGSAGERALVRVLIRLAILLTRSDLRYRVLFLDEPTAANDITYRDSTLKMLSICKKYFNQIIVVTHDHVVSAFAENSLVLS